MEYMKFKKLLINASSQKYSFLKLVEKIKKNNKKLSYLTTDFNWIPIIDFSQWWMSLFYLLPPRYFLLILYYIYYIIIVLYFIIYIHYIMLCIIIIFNLKVLCYSM